MPSARLGVGELGVCGTAVASSAPEHLDSVRAGDGDLDSLLGAVFVPELADTGVRGRVPVDDFAELAGERGAVEGSRLPGCGTTLAAVHDVTSSLAVSNAGTPDAAASSISKSERRSETTGAAGAAGGGATRRIAPVYCDQQVSMETAFAGPLKMGVRNGSVTTDR